MMRLRGQKNYHMVIIMQSWGLALCSSLLLFFSHEPRGILRCVAHVVAGLGPFFSVFFVLQ